MSLSILQSIHPKYCELIASGKKTIEVRKTKPRIPTPFKAYIYQTRHKWVYNIFKRFLLPQGKVIGEYVCDEILTFPYRGYLPAMKYNIDSSRLDESCLKYRELEQYGKGKTLYGYHILNLRIYDKPKELSEFYSSNVKCPYNDNGECEYHTHCYYDGKRSSCGLPLTRAPQSWCYVEEIE